MTLFTKSRMLPTVFCVLVGIFVVLAIFIITPVSVKRAVFPFVTVLAIVFFLLGVALAFLTVKLKVKGPLKKFLLLTGVCSVGFFASVLLHNFFYALGIITNHITALSYLMNAFHVIFFIAGVFVCPLGFLVGVVGSVVIFVRKGNRSMRVQETKKSF